MKRDNTIDALFTLVRVGLWEREVNLSDYREINYAKLYNLSDEQGVIGLVAAGVELMSVNLPLEIKLQIVGSTLQIEQRNKEMNVFIAEQVEKMRGKGIYALLVKGQGVAQCYEKPLWRPSGDVDYLLSDSNYVKAMEYMQPLASASKPEGVYSKHLGLTIGQWYVELHGSLRTALSSRLDKVVDAVHYDVFYGGKVRSWMNGKTQVFLPGIDEDIFFVFSHFIKHFYKEQLSIRQICDWCRLIWTYRDSINHSLLESRINKAGLMCEWRAFAAVAVNYLGMPAEAMPFYDTARKWKRKANLVISLVFSGAKERSPKRILELFRVFPCHTLYFLPGILKDLNFLKIKERYFSK